MPRLMSATLRVEGGALLTADVMDTPGAASYLCTMLLCAFVVVGIILWVTIHVNRTDRRKGRCSSCANIQRTRSYKGHSH